MSKDFIKLSCPSCDTRLKLSAQKLRPKIVCPTCKHTFAWQHIFSWQVVLENSSIPDEAGPDELLDPTEVALMQVEPEALASSPADLGEAGVIEGTLVARSVNGELVQDKAEQWLQQRQQTAERSRVKWQRFGFALVLLALAAIVAQLMGYRFRFLDGVTLRIDGGFGVFYFILLGMVGSYLAANRLPVSRVKVQGIALLVSLLLVGAGIGSFLNARSVDARRQADRIAQQQAAVQPTPNPDRRSAVPIQRNQPGGDMLRRLPPAGPIEGSGRNRTADPLSEKQKAPITRSVPLQPVTSAGDRSEETFRPKDQATDFSVDQLIRETDANPFKSMNAAESGSSSRAGSLIDEGVLEVPQGVLAVPRADVVRDLLGYPEKRAALLQRKKSLLPIRVIGGEIQDAAQFESYQLSETVGKQTKFGWIYFSSQPCRGLDTLKSSTASEAPFELVLPIHGQPEFSDSLYYQKGYYLAGIKVNLQDDRVVGIQALLAPGMESRMDMQKLQSSAWAGQESGDQQFRLNASSGKAVYGIVVYEEKLRITGIGLVQKK